MGAYAEAEKAFATELSLLPADDPQAVYPRGLLRAAEYSRTGDLSALRSNTLSRRRHRQIGRGPPLRLVTC